MAHLITGNKFDPNKDIPDLSDKVGNLHSDKTLQRGLAFSKKNFIGLCNHRWHGRYRVRHYGPHPAAQRCESYLAFAERRAC